MPVCQRCIKRTPTDQQHDCRESDRTERREGKRYDRYSGPSARPDDSKDPTPQAIVDVSAHNQIAGECCPRDVFCPIKCASMMARRTERTHSISSTILGPGVIKAFVSVASWARASAIASRQ